MALLLTFASTALAQTFAVMTLVESDGDPQNTTWELVSIGGENLITATGTDPVNIDADTVVSLLTNDLTIIGTSVIVDTDLSWGSSMLRLIARTNVIVSKNRTLSSTGGDVVLWADVDDDRVGGIRVGSDLDADAGATTIISTEGGDIILGGGPTGPTVGYAHYDAGLGQADSEYRFAVGVFGARLDASSPDGEGGDIVVRGNAGNTFDGIIWTVQIGGQYGANTKLTTSGTGTITVVGDGSLAPANATPHDSRNSWAVTISGTLETEDGAIHVTGKGNTARTNVRGFVTSGTLQSLTGDITLEDHTTPTTDSDYTGPYLNGATFGAGTLAGASGNVTLMADRFAFDGTVTIDTVGEVTIAPYGTAFASAFTWPTNLTVDGSGLTVGSETNTSAVTLVPAITIAGPIRVFGDALTLTGALTATDDTIHLTASGAVTQAAPITAEGLLLQGSGTFTLTHAENAVATIAGGDVATPLGSLTFVDGADGLTIGTIDLIDAAAEPAAVTPLDVASSVSGIEATGDVAIDTLEGDLSVEANVVTASGSATAITLNAGKSAAIGVGDGGNLAIVGEPLFTTGVGGVVRLFSGDPDSSPGLKDAVDADRIRYRVDETTVFDPALEAGFAYALFRTAALSAAESSFTAAPNRNVVADGIAASTLTITTRDAFGIPAAGVDVHVAITDGAGGSLSDGPWTTDANGVATATLTSTQATTIAVTAYLGSDATGDAIDTVTVRFVAGDPDASTSTFAAAPTGDLTADGVAASTLTITARDAFGNPVPDAAVTFTASGGTLGSGPWTTNANGVATTTLTSTQATTLTVRGFLGTNTPLGTATVTFTVGQPDVAESTLTADPTTNLVADGVAASTLTITARDAFGNPVPDAAVTFTTSGGTLGSGPWTTDADGVATTTLTSTQATTLTVTAYLGSDATGAAIGSVTVQFVAGPPARIVAIDGEPQIVAAGEPVESTPRFQVQDAFGNPVAGVNVAFTNDPADGVVDPAEATTDADGFVRVDAWRTSATPGVNTLTAVVAGGDVSTTVTATGADGPDAPRNLVIVPLIDGTGFILLFDPVAGATGYEYRLSPSDMTWTAQSAADALDDPASPRPIVTVTGWAPGDEVRIWVRARVPSHAGPASESATATIRVIDDAPTLSTSVPAADEPLEARRAEDGTITLTFGLDVTAGPDGLTNAWIRAIAVPVGYEIVGVAASSGRILIFPLYPDHWYWEDANLAPNQVTSLQVSIRSLEVE